MHELSDACVFCIGRTWDESWMEYIEKSGPIEMKKDNTERPKGKEYEVVKKAR